MQMELQPRLSTRMEARRPAAVEITGLSTARTALAVAVLLSVFGARALGAGIDQGGFEAPWPSPYPWQIQPDGPIPGNTATPGASADCKTAGNWGYRIGYDNSSNPPKNGAPNCFLFQKFDCGTDANKYCTVTFSARWTGPTGQAVEKAHVVLGKGSSATRREIPVSQNNQFTSYTISFEDCVDQVVIAFDVTGAATGITGTLCIDEVSSACSDADQTSPLLLTISGNDTPLIPEYLVSAGNVPSRPGITDCNGNGEPDNADIVSGVLLDVDHDGVADLCDASIPTLSEWGFIILAALVGLAVLIMAVTRRAQSA